MVTRTRIWIVIIVAVVMDDINQMRNGGADHDDDANDDQIHCLSVMY